MEKIDVNSLKNLEVCVYNLQRPVFSFSLLKLISDDLLWHFAAAVNKLIKEMIPNVRVSNDARELILNCCTGSIE